VKKLRENGRDKQRDFDELAGAVDALKQLVGARFDELDQAGARGFVTLARSMSRAPERGDDGAASAAPPPPAKRITTTWGPPPPRPVPAAATAPAPWSSDDSDVEPHGHPPPRGSARPATAQSFSRTHVRHEAPVPCGTAPPGAAGAPDVASPAPLPPGSRAPPRQQALQQQLAPQPQYQAPQFQAATYNFPGYLREPPKTDVCIPGTVDMQNPADCVKYLEREKNLELKAAHNDGVRSYRPSAINSGELIAGSLILSVGVFHEDHHRGDWITRVETVTRAAGFPFSDDDLDRAFQHFETLITALEQILLPGKTLSNICSTANHWDPYTNTNLGIAPVFDESSPHAPVAVWAFHEARRVMTDTIARVISNAANQATYKKLVDEAVAKTRAMPASSAKSFNPINDARPLFRGGPAGGAPSGSTPPANTRPPRSNNRSNNRGPAAAPSGGSPAKTPQQPAQPAQSAGAGGGQH
jgi:hypothetical protein